MRIRLQGRVSFQEGMIRSYSVAEMPRTGHGHGQHLGHHGHAVHQRNPLNVTAHDHASVQERHRGAAHAANIVPSLPPTHPHYNAYMAGVGEAAEKLLPALEDALSQIAAMQVMALEGAEEQWGLRGVASVHSQISALVVGEMRTYRVCSSDSNFGWPLGVLQRAFEGLARQVSELAKAGTAHSSKVTALHCRDILSYMTTRLLATLRSL